MVLKRTMLYSTALSRNLPLSITPSVSALRGMLLVSFPIHNIKGAVRVDLAGNHLTLGTSSQDVDGQSGSILAGNHLTLGTSSQDVDGWSRSILEASLVLTSFLRRS